MPNLLKNNQLMLHREIIAVSSESRIKREEIQISSKALQVKTQLVLWIFILFKVTTCFGLYHQAIIRSEVNNRI
jgi:hypothetical protein